MLSQLINMAKNELGGMVTQNTELDQDQAEKTIDIGGNALFEGVQEQAMSGNLPQLMGLFSGGLNNPSQLMNNPIVSSIASTFIQRVVSQLGISTEVATNAVNFVLPHLLSFLTKQAGQNSGNLQNLLGMFGNSSGSGNNQGNDLSNMLGGFLKNN